jgi:hypothetical protein
MGLRIRQRVAAESLASLRLKILRQGSNENCTSIAYAIERHSGMDNGVLVLALGAILA